MLGQIGLPGGGFGFGYGSMNRMGQGALAGRGAQPADRTRARSIPTSRSRASPTCCCIRATTIDYNGQRITFPEIKLIYWCGGNPFHHHQDINRLVQAWQRARDRHRARDLLDADGALRRHRAAGDHDARAQRHRLVVRPLHVRDASGDRAGRRGAQRFRHLRRSRADGSASATTSPKAAARWSGCAISMRSCASRPRVTASSGRISRPSGSRATSPIRWRSTTTILVRLSRRSRQARSSRRRPARSRSSPRRSRRSAMTTAPAIRSGSSPPNGSDRRRPSASCI